MHKVLDVKPVLAGLKYTDGDGAYISAYFDAATPATLAIGDVVQLSVRGNATAANNPKVETVQASAGPVKFVVALQAMSVAGLYWFQTGGRAQAKVEGTTDVAIGDHLKGVTGQVYLVQDAALTADPTVAAVATALEAETAASAVLHSVWLKDREAIV